MKTLTKTETKVAYHVSAGLLYKEIADELCVSVHTIHTHLKNIRFKTGARNIADITRMYILSLDNPKIVFKAVMFLVFQFGIMVTNPSAEFRKPANRIVRVGCRTKNQDYA
jgi:DNA-binding CsgD family transcriptional regulator